MNITKAGLRRIGRVLAVGVLGAGGLLVGGCATGEVGEQLYDTAPPPGYYAPYPDGWYDGYGYGWEPWAVGGFFSYGWYDHDHHWHGWHGEHGEHAAWGHGGAIHSFHGGGGFHGAVGGHAAGGGGHAGGGGGHR